MTETNHLVIHPGTYVKDLVIPQGMTVTKASKLLGIGRPALSNFLNGKAALSQEMAWRLDRTFGADREYLLDLQTQFNDRNEAIRTHIASGRHAPTLVEIKAQRLEDWANSIRARDDLSALLRRLVHTTCENATRIDFPAFDNAQRRGRDGEIKTTMPTPWVPSGLSLWEFGCDKHPVRKANFDYNKRTGSIPPRERREATFVFVTPRNWLQKREWAAGKAKLAEWRDIRAYDASDLEQWLEQSAPTQVWFAERLGNAVSGFRSPDKCWSDWSGVCEPRLSSTLFSEPENSSDVFKQWLDKPPTRPFIVAAESPGEALAFSCHLVDQSQFGTDQPGAATLVFDSPEAIRRFRAAGVFPRIAIVHSAEVERNIGDFYRHCHCVIVRPGNDVEGEPDIRLGLPDWRDFSESLETMGMSENRIDQLARETGRSPAVLRRRLATVPAIREPAWVENADTAKKLVAAALVGAWRQTSPSDCMVVRQIARFADNNELESAVTELLALPDSPLWSAGECQGVVSRIDALFGVARFITRSDLDMFFAAAERVLSEPDPALDLPEKERWAAAVHNKVRTHSRTLRNGIRETLVLLSVYGNTLFQNRLCADIEFRVSTLIHKFLTPLTLENLLSHLDDLPDYAEAAPNEFLTLIEADLKSPEPTVHGLLKPADGGPFGVCLRSSLLWALEGLGWNHLERVSAILARLSSIPIDDSYANTPIGSLQSLYRCYIPQTAALLNERTQSLTTLTKRFPDVGWQVCMAQLSSKRQIAFRNHRPRWRNDCTGVGALVENEEFHALRIKAYELVIAWPDHDQRTLGDLVELSLEWPYDHQREIWDLINDWADTRIDDGAKAALRERIRRSALTRRGHRRVLEGDARDQALAAYDRLEPHDPIVRHSWLFANHWIEPSADEDEEDDYDYERRAEVIRGLRNTAIGEIWQARGFEGVTAILAGSGAPVAVGEALFYHIVEFEERIELLQKCLSVPASSEPNINLCLRGFLRVIEDHPRGTLLAGATQSSEAKSATRLFCCAPFCWSTWRLLDRCDPEVRDRYWQEVTPDWCRYSDEEIVESLDRLLDAKRPRDAFCVARLNWAKIETSQLKRLLHNLGTVGSESADQYLPDSYEVSEAIHELDGRDGVDRDEMIGLEFMYVHFLDHSKHGIPNLERWISESPLGFVQILALLFKRDDGGQDPPEWHRAELDNSDALGSAAYRLLGRVNRIPGTDENGDIDSTELSRWIAEARRLCSEHGRGNIGDQYIGQFLARGQADEEGVKPCVAISEAMERVGSQEIALGFHIGIQNARGVYTRAVGEGGNQERKLARMYRGWAKRRSSVFPIVGNTLEGIAKDYDEQARRHDDDAEIQRRLGY
ncbi:MAG: helix-turn-helix domain-containing protein [Rhodobacteraceae bacterium]|nr:helix-turn-helix domain-containing protein [Paracoccaceae bacterium]